MSYFEFKSSVAISLIKSLNKKTISTTNNLSLRLCNKTSVNEKNRIVPRNHFPIKQTNVNNKGDNNNVSFNKKQKIGQLGYFRTAKLRYV